MSMFTSLKFTLSTNLFRATTCGLVSDVYAWTRLPFGHKYSKSDMQSGLLVGGSATELTASGRHRDKYPDPIIILNTIMIKNSPGTHGQLVLYSYCQTPKGMCLRTNCLTHPAPTLLHSLRLGPSEGAGPGTVIHSENGKGLLKIFLLAKVVIIKRYIRTLLAHYISHFSRMIKTLSE
jgi:hypothetical protein